MSVRLSSAAHGSERLAARRRRLQRRALAALCILALLSLGVLLYGLWQPAVRISHVEVQGADASLETIPRDALQGNYFGVIPRDSIFFFPASRMRDTILSTHTDIAAVSISRSGFSSISIKTDMRVPIARWCGSSSLPPSPEDSPLKEIVPAVNGVCYLFDAGGFVYATATEAFFIVGGSSPTLVGPNSDKTLTPFVLFSSLPHGVVSPVGATLKDADRLPATFDFARHLGLSGPPVRAIVIRGDEADFFLATSTYGAATGPRITYLLGDDQNAFTALVSAKGTLNLSDPSLQYVDLRFPGKVYVKRKE